MNTETGELRRLNKGDVLKAEEKLLPRRFEKDATAMLDEGRVPPVALATYTKKVRATASRKRKRKIAQASKRRNRG